MAPPARAEAIPPAIAPNIITSLKWLETNNLFNNLIQRNQSAAFSSGKVRPNHETNINIIARRTGKDVNSHTVLDGIITTIMATIQRINIIGSREGSRNRRRLKANQTGKKFRVGIKSNISTNRNNLISGVDRCIHLNAMKKTTITSICRHNSKIYRRLRGATCGGHSGRASSGGRRDGQLLRRKVADGGCDMAAHDVSQ